MADAVGLKPSASQAKPACAERELQRDPHDHRLSAIGYEKPSASQGEARLRRLTHAVGLKPSAMPGEARLRGTRTPTGTLTIIGYEKPSASQAKPACAG
jgi:hypothetical protein